MEGERGDGTWTVRDMEDYLRKCRAVKGMEMRIKKERMGQWWPLVLEMESLV